MSDNLENENLEGGCSCAHDHSHEHEDGCDCGCEEDTLVIDLEDENGNVVSCPVIDSFDFEEKEYVLAKNPEDDSVYMFRVEGEDGQELVVPDEAEFDKVAKYYDEVLTQE